MPVQNQYKTLIFPDFSNLQEFAIACKLYYYKVDGERIGLIAAFTQNEIELALKSYHAKIAQDKETSKG